jgi:hypothetical protein
MPGRISRLSTGPGCKAASINPVEPSKISWIDCAALAGSLISGNRWEPVHAQKIAKLVEVDWSTERGFFRSSPRQLRQSSQRKRSRLELLTQLGAVAEAAIHGAGVEVRLGDPDILKGSGHQHLIVQAGDRLHTV